MKRFRSSDLAVLSILVILVFVSGKQYAGTRDAASGNGPADVSPFTGSVTLAASGLPSGVTAGFGTNPTTGAVSLRQPRGLLRSAQVTTRR